MTNIPKEVWNVLLSVVYMVAFGIDIVSGDGDLGNTQWDRHSQDLHGNSDAIQCVGCVSSG